MLTLVPKPDYSVSHNDFHSGHLRCIWAHVASAGLVAQVIEVQAGIKVLQEENLDRYLKLETRVGGMSDLIAAAKTVNKETWSELVKCRALISEKTEQQEICQAKLEEHSKHTPGQCEWERWRACEDRRGRLQRCLPSMS